MRHEPEVAVRPGLPVWKVRLILVITLVGVGAVSVGSVFLLRSINGNVPEKKVRVIAGEEAFIVGPVSAEVIEFKVEDPPVIGRTKTGRLGEEVLVVCVRFIVTDPNILRQFSASGCASASATDNFGNEYKRPALGGSKLEGEAESGELVAGKPITTKLIFRKPLDTAESVNLDIPGSAAGVQGEFRFTFPIKGN